MGFGGKTCSYKLQSAIPKKKFLQPFKGNNIAKSGKNCLKITKELS
jgi:hypothetical protein